MASIVWKLITRDIEAEEQTRQQIRHEIALLEERLTGFAPEKLHLQIVLERHQRKPLYTAQLMLRLPANLLPSEKSAPDLMKAFDEALEALLGELDPGKSRHQRRAPREPDRGAEQSQPPPRARFAAEPQPQGIGLQNLRDVIREFFQQHYQRLLYHAQRHIRHNEMTGDVSLGAIDPHDIVDEVARQAEANVKRKPKRMSWLVWLFYLLHKELRRQRDLLKQEEAEAVPTEKPTILPELKPGSLQPLEQMVEEVIEPQVIRTEDVIPNPEAVPPDRILEERELLEDLQDAIQKWPQPEREAFELYYVQGFEPDEIAPVTSQPLTKVKDILAKIQGKLREELLREEAPA
jgi:RNA polymerase sigma factor (sigma-70 family)